MKNEKKYRHFHYTGLLRRSKPIKLDAKNAAHFTQNVEQNGMILLPVSKRNNVRRKQLVKPKHP